MGRDDKLAGAMANHLCQRRGDGSKLLTCVAIAIGAVFCTSFVDVVSKQHLYLPFICGCK